MRPQARLVWWRVWGFLLRGEVWGGALFGLLFLWTALLLAAVAGFAAVVAWRSEVYLADAFDRAFGASSPLERFPVSERNRTAERLERAALDVGVAFAPPAAPEGNHDAVAEAPDDGVEEAFKEYFRDLAWSEEEGFAEPPVILADWLADHARALDRLATLLVEEDPPRERLDLTPGLDVVGPPGLAYLRLDRRLLLAAVAAAGEDDAAAGRFLEASWRLGRPLWDHPSTAPQLAALVVVRDQMAVVRRLPWLALDWPVRLAELDPRGGALLALRLEGWVVWYDRSIEALGDMPPEWTWRWMMVDHARRWLEMVEELKRRDVLTLHPDEFFAEQFASWPRWNIFGRILLANLIGFWTQAHRTALDLELTRRLLEACGDPEAATESAGRSAPSALDGLSWRSSSDGRRLRITLDGELGPYWEADEEQLPLTGVVHLDRCRPSAAAAGGGA